jgi:putative membrane protein
MARYHGRRDTCLSFGWGPATRYGGAVGTLSSQSAIVALHVLANVVWIGSLLSVALLLSATAEASTGGTAARLGRRIYLRLSVPAFAVSLLCGSAVLVMSASSYMRAPWMHAKLTLALAIVAIHHVVGARARRAADGRTEYARGAGGLALAVLACSAGVVWLAVTRWIP